MKEPMNIKTAAGHAERMDHTHRIGDVEHGLTTVAVAPPGHLGTVRALVEGRVLASGLGRPRYRWLGHGMNTRVVESVKLGLHCGACGQLRTHCRCEESKYLASPAPDREAMKRMGARFAEDQPVLPTARRQGRSSRGFAGSRAGIVAAVQVGSFDRGAVFAAVEASNKRFDGYTKEQRRGFSESAADLKPHTEWACKRCGRRTITAGARPDSCGCGCAYFDRVGAA